MPLDETLLAQLRYEVFTSVAAEHSPFSQAIYEADLPGELPNPAHTFLFSGPPLAKLVSVEPDSLTPIGLVQGLSQSSQRQVASIPELGTRYFRLFGGRWNNAVSIQRIMSRQANLVGALYCWYLKQLQANMRVVVDPTRDQPAVLSQGPKESGARSLMAMTLDSDLSNFPLGLYLVHLTEAGEFISGEFWENCMIGSFQKDIAAGGVTVMEAVQLLFSRSVPMGPKTAAGYSRSGQSLDGAGSSSISWYGDATVSGPA